MLIKEIKECMDGLEVSACLSIKERNPIILNKSSKFQFTAVLSDITGDIDFVYFGGVDREKVREIYAPLVIGAYVFVSGTVGTFRENRQIKASRMQGEIRIATPDEVDLDQFIVKTNQNVDVMFEYIVNLIDSIGDKHLKTLLKLFIADTEFVRKFRTLPGARFYHHSCEGGLLEHIWEMLKYCEKAVEIHTSLNKDLVISGAILHDIGKIKENEVYPSVKETREGMLLGHIYLGAEMVKEKISQIHDFPPILETKLLHIILSHHEKKEYGSMIEPKTPEAITVALADAIGSKVTQYIRAKKDSETDDFQVYRKPIGRVFIE